MQKKTAALVALLLLIADQVSKFLVREHLAPVDTVSLIPDVLHFTYVENRGAAFGILQDKQWIFIILTLVITVFAVYLLAAKKISGRLETWAIFLILSGGAGNLIDRVLFGFVTDFIDYRLIHFYVFNIADCCVVVGVCLFVLAVLLDTFSHKKHAKERAEDETA